MRVASISDLHLRVDSDAAAGPDEEDAWLRLFDHLEQRHQRIVLVGDVYQADPTLVQRLGEAEIGAIRARMPRLALRWQSANYQHLDGTTSTGSLSDRLEIVDGKLRAVFIHGHQFDARTRRQPSPSLTAWVLAGLRDLHLSTIPDAADRADAERDHRAAADEDAQRVMTEAATGLILSQKWDVVVMGHSEALKCDPIGRGVYVNSGRSEVARPRFTSIDTNAREVEIREFLDGRSHLLRRWSHPDDAGQALAFKRNSTQWP